MGVIFMCVFVSILARPNLVWSCKSRLNQSFESGLYWAFISFEKTQNKMVWNNISPKINFDNFFLFFFLGIFIQVFSIEVL
jgi:hypothetical protein